VGREVRCRCRWNSDTGEVKALLESREIILRGHFNMRIALSSISEVRVDAEGLRFKVGSESLVFELDASEAVQWASRITKPPPTLRSKLGLGAIAKVLVLGRIRDPALKDALRGAHTRIPAQARMVVAVVEDESELAIAARALEALPPHSFLWIVHGKGPGVDFGESRVRAGMRARGFIDSKVTAVSSTLTATRYSKV
jgi:hypothetical protein